MMARRGRSLVAGGRRAVAHALCRPQQCGHGYGGLVGAYRRGSLEEEEKLIDGTEGVEAHRRRPASGAQPLRRRRRELRQCEASGRGDKERLLGGPYPTGGYVSGHILNIPKIK